MKKIRVLVVDDSAFMRMVISDILNSDEEIEVVGTAKDGIEAVELTKKLKPDVITMDVEMPRMNGIEAVKKIMEIQPTPIVMLSALTKEGSKETLEALEAGAVDIIPKPAGTISLNIRQISDEIIRKVKIAAKAQVRRRVFTKPEVKSEGEKEEEEASKEVKGITPVFKLDIPPEKLSKMAVIIGSSTGGPPVVAQIISRLPRNMPPIFIVQHMSKIFTKMFAKRLDKESLLTVKEAENREKVKPGYAYVAPGDYHMLLKKKCVTFTFC